MGLRVPDAVAVVGLFESGNPIERQSCAAALVSRFDHGRLAVRSSAIGEDGAEASFAGQYETVLDVEGEAALISAIDHCMTSARTARADAYRERQDEPGTPNAPVMSIVVQRMVEVRRQLRSAG